MKQTLELRAGHDENQAPANIDIRDVIAWAKQNFGGSDVHASPFQMKRDWFLELNDKVFNDLRVPEAAAHLIKARNAPRAMPEADRFAIAELLIRLEERLNLAALYNPIIKLYVHALPPFEWSDRATSAADQHCSPILLKPSAD